jgi:hypothetical protein
MGTVDVLRHEAALQEASDSETRVLAWQRACAFLQTQLQHLKSCDDSLRDGCLHLLRCCQSCALRFPRTAQAKWLLHLATLQYHVMRSLHDKADHKVVLVVGIDLLDLLQARHMPSEGLSTLRGNCLVAVVASCGRGAIKLDEAQLDRLCCEVEVLPESENQQALQVVKNLVLSQLAAVKQNEEELDLSTARKLVYLVQICRSADQELLRKLTTQLAKALSVQSICAMLHDPSTGSSDQLAKIFFAECLRRSADEFPARCSDMMSSMALITLCAQSLMPGAPGRAPTHKQRQAALSLISKLPQSSASPAIAVVSLCADLACSVSTTSIHEALRRPGALELRPDEVLEATEVLVVACSAFLSAIFQRAKQEQTVASLSYILHFVAALIKHASIQLEHHSGGGWERLLDQLLGVLQRSICTADSGLVEQLSQSGVQPSEQLLPLALR